MGRTVNLQICLVWFSLAIVWSAGPLTATISTSPTEMQKVGDTGDISLLFFLAGANFWAILGNFWAILAILGHFWAIMGNFG